MRTWGGGSLTLPEGNNFTDPVLGEGAICDSTYSIALGEKALASADYSVAVGYDARAVYNSDGDNATAVGYHAIASMYGTALGSNAKANQFGSIAIGYNANVNATEAILFHINSRKNKPLDLYFYGEQSSLATNTNGEAGMAYGVTTKLSYISFESLFNSANYVTDNGIAIGYNTTVSNSSVAIGNYVTATGDSSVAIGNYVTATGDSSVAIGNYAENSNPYSILLNPDGKSIFCFFGADSPLSDNTDGQPGLYYKQGTKTKYVSLENLFNTSFLLNEDNYHSLTIGTGTTGYRNSLAVGYNAIATGSYSIALGYNAKAEGNYSIVLGEDRSNDPVTNYADTAVFNLGSSTKFLRFFIFGAGSPLASENTSRKPGIGFVNYDGTSGCKKLSELLTDPFVLP